MTLDDVRAVVEPLPRSYEAEVRGSVRFRVGQIVYAALYDDESILGFAFPKEERDALVAGDPETFLMPRTSDLRFNWVCARLEQLEVDELQELLLDAWRMVVPKKVSAAYEG